MKLYNPILSNLRKSKVLVIQIQIVKYRQDFVFPTVNVTLNCLHVLAFFLMVIRRFNFSECNFDGFFLILDKKLFIPYIQE